ncbi:MAG: hypothetical protein GTO18_18345 [Anaerolineales bacterium]|nr:hypothetical protein [Anaerolineales bacterium]
MIFAILGIIAFISPLLGVHNLLNEKKQHLLDESSKQIEIAITTMFSQIEVEGLDSISGNDRTLTTLEKAHETIDKISTWPWQAETLRRVLAALSLPLAIWLIQYFLGQWLSS